MRKFICIIFSFFIVFGSLTAREGMWIPLLIEKYKLAEMQAMGFKLSAEDIYSTNVASMKDAVVVFGSGCTGELISPEGLILTNHHCGYRNLQSHSSVENDYLTNGFWAKSRKEELPNPGLTVRFLEYMEDVTDKVTSGTENMTAHQKERSIRRNSARIERNASEEGKFMTQVKPLFYGNQYYLYVYTVFRDVRLVGAPPSAIGSFGGDTDNWMWPRHTGDFSLFRVYANQENEPADFSPDNVPYVPKKHFSISMNGVEAGDFTMVLGNPGSTMQYIPSYEVDIIMNQRDPNRIAIRDIKMEIITEAMKINPFIRIQYSAKLATISNAWKKWQGEILGLERLDAVEKKIEFEEDFKNWSISNGTWENEYKEVFDDFKELYFVYQDFINAYDFYSEIVYKGIEIFSLASQINGIINSIENNRNKTLEAQLENVRENLPVFFKDYHQPTDEKLFAALLPLLSVELDDEFLPEYLINILEKRKEEDLVKKIYQKSVLTDFSKLSELLEKPDKNQLVKLKEDPLVELYSRLNNHYETAIKPVLDLVSKKIDQNMKIYMAGIMQMKQQENLYPDANLTLRVTYGQVDGYEPKDGVKFKHYTTLEGVMEKNSLGLVDYIVPLRLRELYEKKDFGRYASDGNLPVCFTASNHTTGGNSGSPVLNGEGHLVGLNFDRCWEGTMSDIMYDPELSRNISVDIRYVLFIIDKFAGAGYLLEEMEIISAE